jgi:hypothetical protein
MTQELTFTLGQHITARKTNTELRMLFDRTKGVMYELNESASAVVEALETGAKQRSALIDHLEAQFDAPREEIGADLDSLLADFEKAGLIVRAGS